MVSVEQVRNSVEKHLQGTTHFVVAVEVRPGSKVVVEVDNDRAITLQELADLNKAVREDLGEAADDCEFQFSSPGMGRPFKVSRQYQKHTGRLVQVDLVDGRPRGQTGTLRRIEMGLRIQHPSKVKGRLPKLDDEVTTIPPPRSGPQSKHHIQLIVHMSTVNLIESFREFKDNKNIDRVTMMGILEDVFRGVVKKRFGEEAKVDIIINPDKGDLEIWLNRVIVEDGFSEDDNLEIELAEARKIEPDFEVGEEVSQEVKIEDFGRRNILSLKQNLQSRIMELEKDHLYNKYKERVGEIITGEVYQIWKRETLILDDEGNELIMPKDQQIKTDFFKKGDNVRAVVWKVEMRNNTPVVILSRTAPEFLEKLFEQEVPEVADGLITIKRIVREPGERAKVAVESYDDRIDPVGAVWA
jgi:transcription termination factor NusA